MELRNWLENIVPKWRVRRLRNDPERLIELERIYPGVDVYEAVFMILRGMDRRPGCARIDCTDSVGFHASKGFKNTCSHKCAEVLIRQQGRLDARMEKHRVALKLHYGVERLSQIPHVIEKSRQTRLSRYGGFHPPELLRKHKNRTGSSPAQSRATDRFIAAMESPEYRAKIYERKLVTMNKNHEVHHPSLTEPNVKRRIAALSTSGSVNVIRIERRRIKENPAVVFDCPKCESRSVENLLTFKYRGKHFGTACLQCSGIERYRSGKEVMLFNYVSSLVPNVIANDRNLIHPLEIDILIPDRRIGIEFCGLYWHGEAQIGRTAHRDKLIRCRDAGIDLITIFEDEWDNRSEVVKKIIKTRLGRAQRGPGGRSLEVRSISSGLAKPFLELNHLQGSISGSATYIGGFEDSRLVAVMAFSPSRNNSRIELSRYATDDRIYSGLASKLFRNFVNSHPEVDRIISFADLRWSNGRLYERLGFVETGRLAPDYQYVDKHLRVHKSSLRKTAIARKYQIDIGEFTERELTERLGFERIWDCGKIRMEWTRLESVSQSD